MKRLSSVTTGSGATDCLYNAILSCNIKLVLHRVAILAFFETVSQK